MSSPPISTAMVLDDDKDFLVYLKQMLGTYKIASETYESSVDFLDQVDREQDDVLFLDMVMPEMDGLAALKAIRAVNPQAQVVMVSAVDQKDKLTECIASGAMDFIVKPFDTSRLRGFFERHRQ